MQISDFSADTVAIPLPFRPGRRASTASRRAPPRHQVALSGDFVPFLNLLPADAQIRANELSRGLLEDLHFYSQNPGTSSPLQEEKDEIWA